MNISLVIDFFLSDQTMNENKLSYDEVRKDLSGDFFFKECPAVNILVQLKLL